MPSYQCFNWERDETDALPLTGLQIVPTLVIKCYLHGVTMQMGVLDPGSVHNRTRLTNFNPGFKVKKLCFGGMQGHEIFFYKDLKEPMYKNLNKKLAFPELAVKSN